MVYQATTTPCGHTFCLPCLERSLDYSSTCGICRKPLDEVCRRQNLFQRQWRYKGVRVSAWVYHLLTDRSSHRRCSLKSVFKIWQNSHENTCVRASFLIKLQAPSQQLITKETLAQVFSCAFGEIFKNTFFTEQQRATASELSFSLWVNKHHVLLSK